MSKRSTLLSASNGADINDIYNALDPTASSCVRKENPIKQDVKQPRKPKKASTVTVIYRGKSVAKAVVMDGHVLHGK